MGHAAAESHFESLPVETADEAFLGPPDATTAYMRVAPPTPQADARSASRRSQRTTFRRQQLQQQQQQQEHRRNGHVHVMTLKERTQMFLGCELACALD